MSRSSTAVALLFGLLVPSIAGAHLGLIRPVTRYGTTSLKPGPCGRVNGTRSANVTTFRAGETIEVEWDEYIDHPGHFRISFDADGDDDFVDPACSAGCSTTRPIVDFYSNAAVLMDNIPDTNGGRSVVSLTLPDIECDNCTLQVIQVMYDKPPYTIPGNEMYYQCADLILTRDSPGDGGVAEDAITQDAPSEGDAGVQEDATAASGEGEEEESSCACLTGKRSGRSSTLLLVAVALAILQRTRSRSRPV